MDMRIAGGEVKPTRLGKRLHQGKLVRGMMVAFVVVFGSRTCCIFFESFIHFYTVFMLTHLLLFEDDPYILNTQEIGCPNMIQHAGSVV